MEKFGLYSSRVVIEGELREATITIHDGKIDFVEFGFARHSDITVENLRDAVIMPGLIDSHVHINEPGRTHWEGFDTATRAAAAGGITTLVDMPLNSNPVTTHAKALALKIDAASKSLHVNCGFYGGLVPGNQHELEGLIREGVFGIKVFLTYSGIDEFPNAGEKELREALPILKKHGVTLLVHAEIDSPHPGQVLLEQNPTNYAAYLKSRPKSWEDAAIRLMINLCNEFRSPVHIVHLSSSNSIEPLREAVSRGLPMSIETCPHYLVFHAEGIADKKTLLKCAPPIRERDNCLMLWDAVRTGLISFVVTDHSPAPAEMKELSTGDFRKAWGGIAGLQFSLPAVWTSASEKGFTIQEVSNLMSFNVAEFLGLSGSKGKIAKGFDADLIVWHPERKFTVTRNIIEHRHKETPYEGQELSGVVERTYVGGHKIFDQGKFTALNKGKILKRKYDGGARQ